MSRKTFTLAAMRIVGVISAFWLLQFFITEYLAVRMLKTVFPDHHIPVFPIFETCFTLVLLLIGVAIGLNSKRLAARVAPSRRSPSALPTLIGLTAALYLTGYATNVSLELATIESAAKSRPNFGGPNRVALGYDVPTTFASRLAAPGVGFACIALMCIGFVPPRRQVQL